MASRASLRAAAAIAAAAAVLGAGPTARAQSTAPAQPRPWYETLTVKGFLQLDAVFPQGRSTAGEDPNFRIRRARPTFIANVDPLTRVQVQLDLSTPKSGGGNAQVNVTDTYAERLIPEVAYVSFGQRIIPFGREVIEDNAAVRSPLELSYPAELLALAERDIGITVRSARPEAPVQWAAAFVNGQGFRSADANANKTFVARVTGKVHPWVRVGVSALAGTYRSGGTDYDRHATGYEVQVAPNRSIVLTGELYHAKFVDAPANPTRVTRFEGGYVLLESWVPSARSVPFVRWQRTYGDLDYRSVDLGWRWDFAPTQRLTLEYDIVKGHQRDTFGARWQVNF